MTAATWPGYRGTVAERFWRKVQKTSTCWAWTGATANGYGRFHIAPGKPKAAAHRWSWEFTNGPIPDGFVIDHLCRNPACVNPEHLEPVTQRENIRRSPIAPPGVNMRAATCKRGHALSGDNLYITPSTGYRQCQTCTKARKKARASRGN